MARILYWNVNNFGINKINSPYFYRRQVGSSLNMNAASIQRLIYMLSTMNQQPPDIFVVVETSTGGGPQGTSITAGGAQGALGLLNSIRGIFGGNWMLVPPLILGGPGRQAEGISIYYNSGNLDFTGPWGWQGGGNPSSAITGAEVAYAAPWNNCLPGGAVPVGSPINPGVNMNRLAGQWQFTTALGAAINFPAAGNRPPFYTTFWDAAAGRTIKLFAYHAPPYNPAAANGTNALSTIPEAQVAANEVAVIVGDFNVNIFDAANVATAYNNLTGAMPGGVNYTRHINPTAANIYPNKGYVATHMRSRFTATPDRTNGYPAYGYAISSFLGQDTSSIDNILTGYGGGTAGGPAANFTIVNRVAGSPYNRVAPAPGGAPVGNLAYTTGMAQWGGLGPPPPTDPVALTLPPPAPGGFAPNNIGARSRFKGWANYGKIYSTSDHMALVIDV